MLNLLKVQKKFFKIIKKEFITTSLIQNIAIFFIFNNYKKYKYK